MAKQPKNAPKARASKSKTAARILCLLLAGLMVLGAAMLLIQMIILR